MGYVSERTGKERRIRGKNFRAWARVAGWPAKTKAFYHQDDAWEWVNRTEAAIRAELSGEMRILDRVPSSFRSGTVGAALDLYAHIAKQGLMEKTWRDCEEPIIERWRSHNFARMALDDLRRHHITLWIKKSQKEGVSGGTIRRRLNVLSLSIKYAIDDWRLNIMNPAADHGVPKAKSKRRRPNAEEKAKLYKYAQQSNSPVIYWALRWAEECGMRRAEIANLRPGNIDLSGDMPVLTLPHTKNGNPRSYRMWPELVDLYKQIRRVFGPQNFVFGGIKPGTITQALQRIRKQAGVSTSVSFHSFRYEANSWMVEAGVPRKLRMEIIGHLDDDMSDHYTQFSDEAASIMSKASRHKSRAQPPKPKASKSLKDLSRDDLERLVWTRPASQLAEEMGVSGTALAKRCEREGISKPPRGFWARVRSGMIEHPDGVPVRPISKLAL